MEPDACFAYVEDDRLMVYTASQNVFADRLMICRALGLAPEQVRVRAAFVGGGFGGKDGHTCQIYPSLVSWLTKRPAKVVFDREEVLACTYKRHGIKTHVKMGFSKEGKILAFDGSAVWIRALMPATVPLYTACLRSISPDLTKFPMSA